MARNFATPCVYEQHVYLAETSSKPPHTVLSISVSFATVRLHCQRAVCRLSSPPHPAFFLLRPAMTTPRAFFPQAASPRPARCRCFPRSPPLLFLPVSSCTSPFFSLNFRRKRFRGGACPAAHAVFLRFRHLDEHRSNRLHRPWRFRFLFLFGNIIPFLLHACASLDLFFPLRSMP